MKANDFLNYINLHSDGILDVNTKDIYNSLKRLEELEAKEAKRIMSRYKQKYMLSQGIESLGVTAGHPVILTGDVYIVEHDSDSTIIGLKETIKDGLIEEVKPREVWINIRDSRREIYPHHYAYEKFDDAVRNNTLAKETAVKFVEDLNG